MKYSREIVEQASSQAISITHKHILSIINTKIHNRTLSGPLRILDAGCGNCELIAYLQKFVPLFNKNIDVEVSGFDVLDHKVQFQDYHTQAFKTLNNYLPDIDWKQRIHFITSSEMWPFNSEYFDIVISNQVGEHIKDHRFFFSENNRVLKAKGFSTHLFPLKNYIMEGHIGIPFSHRFLTWNITRNYIKWLSIMGFGKWKRLKHKYSINEYSTSYADFLSFYCNYISKSELLRITKNTGFRSGFNFTGKFYTEKIRELFRKRHSFYYEKENTHVFSIHLLKYISSITLFLQKNDEYINYIALSSTPADPSAVDLLGDERF